MNQISIVASFSYSSPQLTPKNMMLLLKHNDIKSIFKCKTVMHNLFLTVIKTYFPIKMEHLIWLAKDHWKFGSVKINMCITFNKR